MWLWGVFPYIGIIMNYFEIIGLEKSFIMDLKKLEDLYLEKQLLFHPDKLITKSKEEIQESLDQTILLNKAHATLKSCITRALHLLELEGLKIDLEENVSDIPEVLDEIFEEREELESTSSCAELKKLEQKSIDQLGLYKKEFNNFYIKKSFNNAILSFKKMLYKKKFLNCIKQKIKNIGKLECN